MKKYKNILSTLLLVGVLTLCFGFSNGNEQKLSNDYDSIDNVSNEYVFTTSLSGDNEVGPKETDARGQAIVRISKDETTIYYRIVVNKLDNAVAAHLHLGAAGTNGGVLVTLFSGAADGRVNGVLTEGTITSADTNLETLIAAIREGNIYVNVHTTRYPSGELRGQL